MNKKKNQLNPGKKENTTSRRRKNLQKKKRKKKSQKKLMERRETIRNIPFQSNLAIGMTVKFANRIAIPRI